MNALVRVSDDRVMADSRDVADEFSKQHKNVIRSIDRMIRHDDGLRLHFEPNLYFIDLGNGAKRQARCYDMDRKGFMLAVMGFTGAQALAKKSKWIDAFDEMERKLTEQQVLPPLPAPAVPTAMDLREKLLFVREARVLGGKQAGRRAWKIMDLPDVFDSVKPVHGGLLGYDLDEGIGLWLAARTEPDEGWVRSTLLYEDYTSWCAGEAREPRSQTAFGMQLHRRGYQKRVSGLSFWSGLRLKPAH